MTSRIQDNYMTQGRKKKRVDTREEQKEKERARLEIKYCPPVDGALFAAIWNESHDSKACEEILSMLARAADTVLSEEERVDRGETLALQAVVDPKPVQNAAVSSERNKKRQKRKETRNKQAKEDPVQTDKNHNEVRDTDEELVRDKFESWALDNHFEKDAASAFMPDDFPTDDQGVPTMDTTTTTISSPSSHDDNDAAAANPLYILCACFPTRPLAELAALLDQYSGSLDQALDAILQDSDSIEAEEAASVFSFSSSSSTSAALNSPQDDAESNSTTSWEELHGDEDRTFGTERGDEYFDDDPTTNIAASKRARRAQRNLRKKQVKRNVLFETGLPVYGPRVGAASSLLDAAYPPLPPQPNKWHRLDAQVDAFTRAFPSLPRTTIASILHQYGGDAVEAVERLAAASGAEPVWKWEKSKEVDTLLGNLMNVFPEHDVVTLERVVLGVMVEAEVEGWEKERLVERAVEVVLSRDRKEEEVKAEREREESMRVNGVSAWEIGAQGLKGGKTPFLPQGIAFDQATGEFVAVKGVVNGTAATARGAAATARGTAATARSAWTDNRRAKAAVVEEKYDDDDYDDPAYCRQMAMEYTKKRNEAFMKAATAFQKAKGKRGGEGGIALYYSYETPPPQHIPIFVSQQGQDFDIKAKAWSMRAARASVKQHKVKASDDHLIDLHGLTVNEATTVVQEGVTQWWARSMMRSGEFPEFLGRYRLGFLKIGIMILFPFELT
ncbi:hypothetical protein BC937DRAFT_93780 [Endogone sp. FLAS-F59071]|nr:hypothetical protein BC937DRAFT_93780 [Endogone sp. FLAS-F59071]|eukprot:RUS14468.1 hypothetical protein BC937DRAFT_93780 [Endogone sp. FLAS-F59071]